MFKMFEKKETQSYRLDTSNANMSQIVPGSILYNGANGARLATAGDTMTVEDAGLFLVSNDYANNTSMASIYGQTDLKSAYIAALPITDLECIEYDFSENMAPGTLFTVLDGEFVPVSDTIPAPILVIGVTKGGSDRDGNVKITTYTAPYEIQPSLYLVNGNDAAMVEGARTAVITLSIAGKFIEAEVEKETNWTISTDTGFNDVPTFTVDMVDDHTVTITFDAGSGKTISFTGTAITMDVAQEAVVDARDDIEGYEYSPNESDEDISLTIDGTGMVAGSHTCSAVISITGAEFDTVNALDETNWTVSYGDTEAISFEVTPVTADSATITFDAGAEGTIADGTVTIKVNAEAIVGMNSGETADIEYEIVTT